MLRLGWCGLLILLHDRTGWALAKQNQELDDMGAAVEKAAAAAAAAGSSAAAGRYVVIAFAATQVVLQTAACWVDQLHAAGTALHCTAQCCWLQPVMWLAVAAPGAAAPGATGI